MSSAVRLAVMLFNAATSAWRSRGDNVAVTSAIDVVSQPELRGAGASDASTNETARATAAVVASKVAAIRPRIVEDFVVMMSSPLVEPLDTSSNGERENRLGALPAQPEGTAGLSDALRRISWSSPERRIAWIRLSYRLVATTSR